MTSTKTNNGTTLTGTVVSKVGINTVGVLVSRYVKHPKYEKFQKKTKKFLVHDEGNTAEVGEKVTITETRPLSKMKKFTLVK